MNDPSLKACWCISCHALRLIFDAKILWKQKAKYHLSFRNIIPAPLFTYNVWKIDILNLWSCKKSIQSLYRINWNNTTLSTPLPIFSNKIELRTIPFRYCIVLLFTVTAYQLIRLLVKEARKASITYRFSDFKGSFVCHYISLKYVYYWWVSGNVKNILQNKPLDVQCHFKIP